MLGIKHTDATGCRKEPHALSEECPSLCCASSHCFAGQCECCCTCDIAEREPQMCYVFILHWALRASSRFSDWAGNLSADGLLLKHLYQCGL